MADNYLKLFKQPLFIIIYLIVMVMSYFYWDQAIALYFHQLSLGVAKPILNFITKLGLGGIYLVLFAVLFIIFKFIYRNRQFARNSLFLFLAVILAGILCDIIKIILGRARPELLFANQQYGFYFFKWHAPYWSFPSGHATVIIAVTAALWCLKPRYWPLFLIIALLVMSTRVILTDHYLSDVMAGLLLANVSVFYLQQLFERFENSRT